MNPETTPEEKTPEGIQTKITKEGFMVIEGDLISSWVEETGRLDHDLFLIPLAVANIPENGVAIDCGANIGTHSVAYARKLTNGGTLICIEAGKTAFECLAENAKNFECQTVLINCAVCDIHEGRAVHSVNKINVGGSTVGEQVIGEVCTNEVRTITLDALIEASEIKRLDFIKIDCEGGEFSILQGARSILKRFKPKMLIELNSVCLEAHGHTYKMIYDWLIEQNYEWRICEPQCKGGDDQYNILCWPRLIELVKHLPDGL